MKWLLNWIKKLWEKPSDEMVKKMKEEAKKKIENEEKQKTKDEKKDEEDLDGLEDYNPPTWTYPIPYVVNLFGTLLFAGMFYLLAKIWLQPDETNQYFIHGAIIWAFFYIAQGLMINNENEFIVVERLGQFYRIKMDGGPIILCLRGVIDKVAQDGGRGDFRSHRIDLYSDESNEIDFTDASAPVKAQIWYRIKKTREAVYRWVYRVENSRGRIEEVFDGIARPLLQNESIDEAQKNLVTLAGKIIGIANKSKILDSLGAELDEGKKPEGAEDMEMGGFIITDIAIPENVQEIREQTLQGLKDAEAATARGAGYFGAIKSIIDGAKKMNVELSFEEAKSLYEKQRGLETIEKTGANITFVGENVKGVLATLGINDKK